MSSNRLVSSDQSIPYMNVKHRLSMFTSGRGVSSLAGIKLAVVTAGDDSQGMNAAIRAVVRMAIYLGCHVTYIKHGFKGMVDGTFEDASWFSSSDIVSDGGTYIKSYKCPEFLTKKARVQAARHLVERNIHNLVAIGGDGTLKGISVFHKEWTLLLRDLVDQGLVSREATLGCRNLKVVCLLASIVNDVVGTDYSIGCDSALHRIIEATDGIATTSSSSQLAFVVEVMGKTSGFLALCTGIACDASMIFIPEWPPQGDWKEELFYKVQDDLRIGSEGILILVSEGATDNHGRRISCSDVQQVLMEKLNLNAKITVLGHVQRGGSPSCFDRLLATRMGAEGIMALRDLPLDVGCCVMGTMGNEIICMPLAQCIEKTGLMEKALQDRNYPEAVRIRGRYFQALLSAYIFLHGLKSSSIKGLLCTIPGTVKVGLMRVGKSSLGQCVVARAVIAHCQSKDYCVLGIMDGFEGLVAKRTVSLCWDVVKHWSNTKTVSCLGASQAVASSFGLARVADSIQALGLSGLVIIGGFHAFRCLVEMDENKTKYPGLSIPACVIPVTILNNMPGSDLCVGSDTALNEIVGYCDKIKRVARGQKNYVFIIETLGYNCGYLATVSALCVGADNAYIRQERFNLESMIRDVEHLRHKIQHSGVQIGMITCSDSANDNYDMDFIHRLFAEEGKGVFTCRASKIGQVQLGSVPSPQDRVLATLAGIRCGEWLSRTIENCTREDGRVVAEDHSSMSVLCIGKRSISFKPVSRLACETDFNLNLPTFMWWTKLRPLMRIMAKHYDRAYEVEAEDPDFDESLEDEQEGQGTSAMVDTRVHKWASDVVNE